MSNKSNPLNESSKPKPARAQKADEYFDESYNLAGQRGWYSEKASTNKKYHHWLGLVIVVGGSLTAVVQIWAPAPPEATVHWSTIVTALLGAMVVIAKGIERIWDFDGNWAGYRKASELMKREKRLYINGAGSYLNLNDDLAHLKFIERIENILTEEQQLFWQNKENSSNDNTAK